MGLPDGRMKRSDRTRDGVGRGKNHLFWGQKEVNACFQYNGNTASLKKFIPATCKEWIKEESKTEISEGTRGTGAR